MEETFSLPPWRQTSPSIPMEHISIPFLSPSFFPFCLEKLHLVSWFFQRSIFTLGGATAAMAPAQGDRCCPVRSDGGSSLYRPRSGGFGCSTFFYILVVIGSIRGFSCRFWVAKVRAAAIVPLRTPAMAHLCLAVVLPSVRNGPIKAVPLWVNVWVKFWVYNIDCANGIHFRYQTVTRVLYSALAMAMLVCFISVDCFFACYVFSVLILVKSPSCLATQLASLFLVDIIMTVDSILFGRLYRSCRMVVSVSWWLAGACSLALFTGLVLPFIWLGWCCLITFVDTHCISCFVIPESCSVIPFSFVYRSSSLDDCVCPSGVGKPVFLIKVLCFDQKVEAVT